MYFVFNYKWKEVLLEKKNKKIRYIFIMYLFLL